MDRRSTEDLLRQGFVDRALAAQAMVAQALVAQALVALGLAGLAPEDQTFQCMVRHLECEVHHHQE